MSTSLIRSRAIIARAIDRQNWEQIDDGAVLQEHGAIAAAGTYAVREQNRLVYQAADELVASLPKDRQDPMKRWFERFKVSLDDAMGMFEQLHAKHNSESRVKIQLAPANLHWCSDKALGMLSE